jgi:hypothetical protein
MKSIFKTTGKLILVLTALFVYVSTGRMLYALYGDMSHSLVSYLYFTIVCGFITFLCFALGTLLYHELFKK